MSDVWGKREEGQWKKFECRVMVKHNFCSPLEKLQIHLHFYSFIRIFHQRWKYFRSKNCKYICIFTRLFVSLQPIIINKVWRRNILCMKRVARARRWLTWQQNKKQGGKTSLLDGGCTIFEKTKTFSRLFFVILGATGGATIQTTRKRRKMEEGIFGRNYKSMSGYAKHLVCRMPWKGDCGSAEIAVPLHRDFNLLIYLVRIWNR